VTVKLYKATMVLIFLLVLATGVGWVKNIIKLADCDFQAPYKAEVIHTIGLIPFVGLFTGWVDVGK
tara:strand:+ start:72 stop:269 length:198 start_codon:yes stop_codon:yes gene_type:complete